MMRKPRKPLRIKRYTVMYYIYILYIYIVNILVSHIPTPYNSSSYSRTFYRSNSSLFLGGGEVFELYKQHRPAGVSF